MSRLPLESRLQPGWSSGFSLGSCRVKSQIATVCELPSRTTTVKRPRLKPELQPTKGTNHGLSLRRIFEITGRLGAAPRITPPAGGRVRRRRPQPSWTGYRLGTPDGPVQDVLQVSQQDATEPVPGGVQGVRRKC